MKHLYTRFETLRTTRYSCLQPTPTHLFRSTHHLKSKKLIPQRSNLHWVLINHFCAMFYLVLILLDSPFFGMDYHCCTWVWFLKFLKNFLRSEKNKLPSPLVYDSSLRLIKKNKEKHLRKNKPCVFSKTCKVLKGKKTPKTLLGVLFVFFGDFFADSTIRFITMRNHHLGNMMEYVYLFPSTVSKQSQGGKQKRITKGGGCSRGGGNWGTLRIPRQDWWTLGNIRGITTPLKNHITLVNDHTADWNDIPIFNRIHTSFNHQFATPLC